MSDELKHECGVTLLKLRKPASEYPEHYGLQKLALLLEKQHNRGQDGAGVASLSLEATPGFPYFHIEKSNASNPLAKVLEEVWNHPFDGDLFLGHLRYGTFGEKNINACHPLVKQSVCRNRTLLLAGNFNLTNSRFLFDELTNLGHHLSDRFDTSILLHMVGHELEKMLNSEHALNMNKLLNKAASSWDGGFLICGVLGDGNAFALRDPQGIRPGFYYYDDDIVVVASERPAIQTAFNLKSEEIKEIPPGHILTVTADNQLEIQPCLPTKEIRRCVFERIYFSRSNDCDIQQERRMMGKMLIPQILEEIDYDMENSFFSYIPNTAQISFHGLLDEFLHKQQIRFGQIIVKDAKFRTFIADQQSRNSLDMHIYDIVYGLVKPGVDNLIVIDDSIVRGTTLRNLILRILDRLEPKKIVVVSAAPIICYPDCYGIDMASLGELIGFQAAVSLLKKRNHLQLLDECFERAKRDLTKTDHEMKNQVKPIYDAFTPEELSEEIALLLKPEGLKSKFSIIFQKIDNLHQCCPNHSGDWYFSGNYPTPGGFRVVNQALVNYINKTNQRAY